MSLRWVPLLVVWAAMITSGYSGEKRPNPEEAGPRAIREAFRVIDGLYLDVVEDDPERLLERALFEGRAERALAGAQRQGAGRKNALALEAALDRLVERRAEAALGRLRPVLAPGPEKRGWPPAGEWRWEEASVRCALEAARCLLALGRKEEAATAFEAILSRHGSGWVGVMALEGGGDLFAAEPEWGKAEGFYRRAVEAADRAIDYEKNDPRGEVAFARERLRRKAAWAERMKDRERYGPGFVLYREAERLRRCEKRWLEAYAAYREIETHSETQGTVYAEAAGAYKIHCLLALADPAAARSMAEAVERARVDLQKLEWSLARATALRQKAPEVLAQAEAEAQRRRNRLSILRSVSAGETAADAAAKAAEEFLAVREFGLYRGEVLCALAEEALDRRLEAEQAQSAYSRAWAWLDRVERETARLDAFEVPAKAAEPARPPAEERKRNEFGTAVAEPLPPGAVVNRQTCSWYLDDLRERCALALGFLAFARGEKEVALGWIEKVPALDAETGRLEREGQWNAYRRLRWGAEHGFLNASPGELAPLQGRARFAAQVADFCFCVERSAQAASLVERLLAGEFGRLSRRQEAYPRYLLACCHHWEKDREAALAECRRILAGTEWTPTHDRASFTAANLAWTLGGEAAAEGLEILRRLAASDRNTPQVPRARLALGIRLLQLGDPRGAAEWLRRVPETDTGCAGVARRLLASLDKARGVSGKED